ncbi:hypothetical protein CDD82_1115 [Ophiocordyceps australis]|uniref:Epoxide hydrolase N-terminal domain-containing protein n=1 Tax=Ophiocordyceps australis TaxID=1399860 RepID=A0A2C5ZPD9_9HYPO|nr:hypothetical protein CDD82_1115 [Ophiocordyceps australis]
MSHTNGVEPFKISVPESALQALREKLQHTTFPDAVEFSDDWNYGAPRSHVQRLAEYWKDGFDWRAQEARLNAALPQFMTEIEIDGFGPLQVHLVHKESSRPGSIPLLFCHGWPGSFLEVIKVLPLLVDPAEGPSFHVVAPSLPNFGFSGIVKKRGFGLPQYAECMHKVMAKLGYNRYVTQGGDWGSLISRMMGVLYPQHCLASHVNFIAVRPSIPQYLTLGFSHALKWCTGWHSALERARVARMLWYITQGAGYMMVQANQPANIGLIFADSPLALLTWIYEKLYKWTDDYPWTDDEVLTWISIYQFSTAGAAASVRIYYEAYHAEPELTNKCMRYVPRVPLGISYFPKDLLAPPRDVGRAAGNVVFEAEHLQGGHFAAYECPEQLCKDVAAMFGPEGGAGAIAQKFQGNALS